MNGVSGQKRRKQRHSGGNSHRREREQGAASRLVACIALSHVSARRGRGKGLTAVYVCRTCFACSCSLPTAYSSYDGPNASQGRRRKHGLLSQRRGCRWSQIVAAGQHAPSAPNCIHGGSEASQISVSTFEFLVRCTPREREPRIGIQDDS